MTDEQLRALLRVKRFEQPPPGYFDQLLRDIHRRQRAELLRRPLWKIALERMQTFFGEHSMSPASYAGAMATLLIIGVGVIGVVLPGTSGVGTTGTPSFAATTKPQSSRRFTLQASLPEMGAMSGWESPSSRFPAKEIQGVRHPRYVIDARPASYEPPASY